MDPLYSKYIKKIWLYAKQICMVFDDISSSGRKMPDVTEVLLDNYWSCVLITK